MTLVLSMIAMLLTGFAFGVFLSKSSRRSEREAMLERRVKLLLLENADLQCKLGPTTSPGRPLGALRPELVDVTEVLPAAPTTIRWREWVRTVSEKVPEWERWDESDSWYLTVSQREDGQWGWYTAYAPNAAENAVSQGGVVPTMEDARQIAQDQAENWAKFPSTLKAAALGLEATDVVD